MRQAMGRLLWFAAVWVVAGCDREPLEVESRDLGEYRAIDLRGAVDVVITVGQSTTLRITGAAYAVKGVKTEVRDDTLFIEAKRSGWAWFGDNHELQFTITLPELKALRSSGAGHIKVRGLAGGEQEVRVAGAHYIEAEGHLDKLDIEVEGAGNVDYGGVVTQEARVVVNGAGHVLVRPMKLLDAAVNGVGAIRYQGDPEKVASKIQGLGTIGRQ